MLFAKCPRWEHIVTKNKYSPNLARTQLLNNPVRSTLGEVVNTHFALMTSAKNLCHEWQQGTPSEIIQFQQAEASLNTGWEAMAIIAAVNVVELFHDKPDGPGLAEDLLKKTSDFPQHLKEKLKAIERKKA